MAVKVIHPELAADEAFRSRFRREVAAARQVSGMYTAPVVAAGLDDDPLWLATAFVAGPSLTTAVAAHGRRRRVRWRPWSRGASHYLPRRWPTSAPCFVARVLVCGPPGVGKTALIAAAGRDLARDTPDLLAGAHARNHDAGEAVVRRLARFLDRHGQPEAAPCPTRARPGTRCRVTNSCICS